MHIGILQMQLHYLFILSLFLNVCVCVFLCVFVFVLVYMCLFLYRPEKNFFMQSWFYVSTMCDIGIESGSSDFILNMFTC